VKARALLPNLRLLRSLGLVLRGDAKLSCRASRADFHFAATFSAVWTHMLAMNASHRRRGIIVSSQSCMSPIFDPRTQVCARGGSSDMFSCPTCRLRYQHRPSLDMLGRQRPTARTKPEPAHLVDRPWPALSIGQARVGYVLGVAGFCPCWLRSELGPK